MNKQIQTALTKGNLILLFGAGASITSFSNFKKPIVSSKKLAKIIAEEVGWEYCNEDLSTVYSAAIKQAGRNFVHNILVNQFRHAIPSTEYQTISKYAWPRIYTLNIDDALENAFRKYSSQNINIRHKDDPLNPQDSMFQELDIIKLNGSIDRLQDGIIFSPKEYGEGSANVPNWYKALANDFFNYCFLFIGSELHEPIFEHQIARHKNIHGDKEAKSYVLTPSATDIQKASLETHGIIHVPGTFSDFTNWLKITLPNPTLPQELAIKNNPSLKMFLEDRTTGNKADLDKALERITLIKRNEITKNTIEASKTKVRKFYRGFKPDWIDIADDVPAFLTQTQQFYLKVLSAIDNNQKLVAAFGPAGSGKTTIIMQVALKISDRNIPVYFIEEPIYDINILIEHFESIHDEQYCIFTDRLSDYDNDLRRLINNNILNKGLFVGSERQNIWESRCVFRLYRFCKDPLKIARINEYDANQIIKKIHEFGPWFRLGNMSKSQRINELLKKSKNQLLIGLLEATSGQGYKDIIENDYLRLEKNKDQKSLLLLVGFATINRLNVDENHILHTLQHLGIGKSLEIIVKETACIVFYRKRKLYARHPVYIEYLFTDIVDNDSLFDSFKALIYSFGGYQYALNRLPRRDRLLFNSLINFNKLRNIFMRRKDIIERIYNSNEKLLEHSPVFWLQYGLALRANKDMNTSLECFKKSYSLWYYDHKKYALYEIGVQEILIAMLSDNKKKAYSFLESARKRLESLHGKLNDDDIHPIIALGEGHIKVIFKFAGIYDAREVSKKYSNILLKEKDYIFFKPIDRACKTFLNFALSGKWTSNLKKNCEKLELIAEERLG